MLRYFFNRLIQGIIVMIVLFTLTFFLVKALPGSPFKTEKAIPEHIQARMNAYYGLDQPLPVQFAKRVVGRRMYGGQSTYIPLKVNQSGVIPIIFASSVLYLPNLIAVALPSDGWGGSVQSWVDNNLANPAAITYLIFFGLLIVGFAYFYTAISFDPAKQADTIRKQGGFIPGIRPGPQTERYLARILSRITFPGAMFIAAVALVPSILINLTLDGASSSNGGGAGAGGFAFGGISLLIASGVALETMKQIDSQLMMRNYEGFLK